jgi:protein-tyrosine phosphatase
MMPFEIYAYKEFELFGSEMPQSEVDINQIRNAGIKVIISLDEDIEEHPDFDTIKKEFEHHKIYINDFEIPTKDQIEQILTVMEEARKKEKPILVHCLAGCGRTGLVLALAERFLYDTKDGEKAIEMVRKIRPCAIETQRQYDFVINYKR